MTNVIEFGTKPDVPDDEFVRKDDYGREMFCFALSYNFDGGTWSAEIWAYSMEEAQQRVNAMRESLALDGQLFGSVPA